MPGELKTSPNTDHRSSRAIRGILIAGMLIGLSSINPGKEETRQAVEIAGAEFGSDDTVVALTAASLTDAELAPLGRLTNLETVLLCGEQITGLGLHNLKGLTHLRMLNVYCDHFAESGLESLAGMPDLHSLTLHSDQLTDVGLETLSQLKSLTGLHLDSNQITDAGMQYLPQLKDLTFLTLHSNQITDAGLRNLPQLENLALITLQSDQITDHGLQHLSERKGLVSLSIDSSRITDDGLQYFAGLNQLQSISLTSPHLTAPGLATLWDSESLKYLTISSSAVSPSELDALRIALPSVEIQLSDDVPDFVPAKFWQRLLVKKALGSRKLDLIEANAVRFYSGDTIGVVTATGTSMQIRLIGIDAPEWDQPFAVEARQHLKELLEGKPCWILTHGSKRSWRNDEVLADVYTVHPANGERGVLPNYIPLADYVNASMVGKGYAWSLLGRFTPGKDFSSLQAEARKHSRGLWAASGEPISPSKWQMMPEDEREEHR